MSTPAQITTLLLAIAATAAVTGHLTRLRTACYRTALAAAAHAARRDHLTGLGNRSGFHAALATLLAEGRPAAVILLNLDSTRAFVARFGHRVLDQVLVLTAGRLQHVASDAGASVFRLRRDEFAIVLADDRVDSVEQAGRLIAAVAEPTEVHLSRRAVTVTVTACAGIAAGPHADGDVRLALVRADRAMRAAKRTGPGHSAVFDPATMHGPNASPADGGQVR